MVEDLSFPPCPNKVMFLIMRTTQRLCAPRNSQKRVMCCAILLSFSSKSAILTAVTCSSSVVSLLVDARKNMNQYMAHFDPRENLGQPSKYDDLRSSAVGLI
jgi:hypothetical protein